MCRAGRSCAAGGRTPVPGRRSYECRPLGEQTHRPERRYASATTGHAMAGANRRASAAIDAGQTGSVSTRRSAPCERVGVVVVDDDAGAAGQQLDARGERPWRPPVGRRRWRRPAHPRSPDRWSRTAAPRRRRTALSAVSDGDVAVVGVEGHRVGHARRDAPARCARCDTPHRRRRRPSGCVCPATR